MWSLPGYFTFILLNSIILSGPLNYASNWCGLKEKSKDYRKVDHQGSGYFSMDRVLFTVDGWIVMDVKCLLRDSSLQLNWDSDTPHSAIEITKLVPIVAI